MSGSDAVYLIGNFNRRNYQRHRRCCPRDVAFIHIYARSAFYIRFW